MKQKFLLKAMLLLCALVVGSSSVWADKSTLTFTAACGGSGTADDNASWTVTSDATESSFDNPRGIHYGTGSAAVSYLTLTTSDISGTITQIKVNASGASKTSAKLNVTVNGSAFGSEQSLTSSAADYTLTGSASGTIVVSLTQTSTTKALYVKSIEVTYSSSGGSGATTATTVTIDASSINANIFVGTNAGSFAATVKADDTPVDGATVTWSSSDTEVATINATTGAVTLKAEGTTTITASYAGDANYQASSNTYMLTVINENPAAVEIWSENFSTYSADDVPNGGTYKYVCTDGGGTTKIYNANVAGGTSPELLIGKSNGTFTATIPLRTSTYGYSGDLTLNYKTNATALNVKTNTDGITVDGENEGAGLIFNTAGTHKITFKGVTTSTGNITIVFTSTTDKNVRIDDIVLKGVQEELTQVATPTISPASGAIASGTEVTITCLTDGVTIYYTTDGTTPNSGSTAYNPASKPTITSACTIKAIGIKDGLSDSEVAEATYTIAAPCATPTFSPAAGEVAKGTTVTISTETADAIIYYTTDGTDPTTSSTVYSSAITINSAMTIKAIAAKDGNANSAVATAVYTIIDYATLPFTFDEGKSSLPTGLTESGLGTDYGSSPKLKFDHTGDYLILKINEVPGTLAFDILGNGFSGGTFKVQASADGETYSDLKVYTSLGSKTTERFILGSTVRYIKWVYTTKSSGNVALGNINLSAYSSPISITPAKEYTTLTCPYPLNFTDVTGLEAYIVKDDDGSDDYITLTQVNKVPANTGLVLKASSTGSPIDVPVLTDAADDVTGNLMVGSATETTAVTENGGYILKNGVFQPATAGTLAAGKAYLAISVSAPFLSLDFGNEATNIADVRSKMEDVKGEVYNLNGQRVAQPTKGLYIVNGKKVVLH